MATKRSTKKAPAKKTLKSISLPALKKGEVYKGLIVSQTGKPLHHVVEKKISATNKTWTDALAFAKAEGYALPDRKQGALLRASDASGQSGWFWLSEQYEAHTDFAWAQYFGHGGQLSYHESIEFRVRLVRTISVS